MVIITDACLRKVDRVVSNDSKCGEFEKGQDEKEEVASPEAADQCANGKVLGAAIRYVS